MNPSTRIRTLVVDDEPLARDGITTLLAQDPEIELVGTCADGASAITVIRAQRPDLVFLDIQMPKKDGFEVLADLKREERPTVIFITAYDKYAIRAFELCALDYLLKPFRDGRFFAALDRAKKEIRQARSVDLGQKVEQLLGYMRELSKGTASAPAAAAAGETADRVVLKTGSDIHFVPAGDIIWVESQADFIKVHTTGSAQLVRETLQSLEDRLDPARFLRIHRSSLVNLEHVRKVTPALYGDYTVLMSDDTKLRLSRKNRGKLKQLIARLSAGGGDS
jgi:two-component system LytT family response regulator